MSTTFISVPVYNSSSRAQQHGNAMETDLLSQQYEYYVVHTFVCRAHSLPNTANRATSLRLQNLSRCGTQQNWSGCIGGGDISRNREKEISAGSTETKTTHIVTYLRKAKGYDDPKKGERRPDRASSRKDTHTTPDKRVHTN